MRLDELDPEEDGLWRVVVEALRGATLKLKYRPELGAFGSGRPLPLGMHYPYDWGFVPRTEGPDGDPLDAMVLHDVPSVPGTVLLVRPVGLLKVSQRSKKARGRQRNDRMLAVQEKSATFGGLKDVRKLPAPFREELAHFFLSIVALTGKDARIEGWAGPAETVRWLEAGMR